MVLEELENIQKRNMIQSMIDSFRLSDLMAVEFDTVEPDSPLYDVLSKMKNNDLHEIPVVERDNFEGVVSFGTLLKRKALPLNTKAKSVMETPPEMHPDTRITEVAEKLVSTGYRQMPVIRNNRLEGIISRKNLIGIIPKIRDLRNIKVESLMTTEVYTIGENDPIVDAVELMREMDIRTLPVVDNHGRLSGIIGVKDIVDYHWREKQKQTMGEVTGNSTPVTIRVSSLAVDTPITTRPDSSIGEIAELMLDRNISTLPVLAKEGEEEELVGIITTYDIIELITTFKEREMVYVQISGLEEEDAYELEMMEKEIQTGLSKIAPISTPLLFTVHVSKYHKEGTSSKYSLSARLTTEHKIYLAKAHDWSLIRATVELMNRLDRTVKEDKEEYINKRKGGR